jgi:hypothetical protein
MIKTRLAKSLLVFVVLRTLTGCGEDMRDRGPEIVADTNYFRNEFEVQPNAEPEYFGKRDFFGQLAYRGKNTTSTKEKFESIVARRGYVHVFRGKASKEEILIVCHSEPTARLAILEKDTNHPGGVLVYFILSGKAERKKICDSARANSSTSN